MDINLMYAVTADLPVVVPKFPGSRLESLTLHTLVVSTNPNKYGLTGIVITVWYNTYI